jgi:hypothetical protein
LKRIQVAQAFDFEQKSCVSNTSSLNINGGG